MIDLPLHELLLSNAWFLAQPSSHHGFLYPLTSENSSALPPAVIPVAIVLFNLSFFTARVCHHRVVAEYSLVFQAFPVPMRSIILLCSSSLLSRQSSFRINSLPSDDGSVPFTSRPPRVSACARFVHQTLSTSVHPGLVPDDLPLSEFSSKTTLCPRATIASLARVCRGSGHFCASFSL